MIDETATYCSYCGGNQLTSTYSAAPAQPVINDSGSFGWFILGFFLPPVGFILWLAWMGVKPKCSRMAGLGVLGLILFCVVVTVVSSLMVSLRH